MAIKKEFKIGVYVILVLIATVIVINVLRGTDIFGRKIEYRGYFYDVETLVPSSPVLFRGYNAGKVSEVSYDSEKDLFLVVCSIEKEFSIPDDSRMMLYSTSIMGGKGVRIVPGVSSVIAGDGAELESGSEADMLSMLSGQIVPVMEKVNALLDSATVTVNSVNDVLGEENRRNLRSVIAHLDNTVKNAENLTADLGGESEGISEIIANLKQISENLVPVMDSVGVAVGNVNSITGNLADADLKSTVERTGEAIDNVNELVGKIKEPLEDILKDTDDLIKAIKENPRKYMKLSVF